MEAQSSWENTLKQIVPDDVECYTQAARVISDTGRLDVKYRILLNDNTIKHIREISLVIKDPDKSGNSSLGILQDISEQVNRERDLKYREELSQQAESITDIGHYIYDELNENYTFLSEGYARIYGTTVDDYMAKMQSFEDDLSDVHPDDRERVVSEYERYLKGTEECPEECPIEYRIIRSNGQVRWIRELGKARRFEDGKVIETLGVVQDITMQVNHEQELLFKATIVSEVEAIADIGYFLFDEKVDRSIFVSPGQAKIVGLDIDTYNEKIVTNDDYISLVYDEDQALVRKAYEHDIHENGQWAIEYRVVKPDGSLCWIFEIGKTFKRDETGVEQSIGLIRDITNQKLIEQELLYKDALANQAETITDIGHFVYDELAEKYLFVSPGYARILGIDDIDLMSKLISRDKDLARVYKDDRAQVSKAYDSFLINSDTWQVEYRLVRTNGDIRWVREMGKTHLMNHGIVEQSVGVLQDITEQKHTEQALLESKDTLEQQVLERTRELSNTVKQLQEQIEERKKVEAELDFLANHDALTGLPSLRLCKDRLERSLATARRNTQLTAVMFLDLDGFKVINDALGHETGDQVLIATAKRIQQEIRETDTVARIGGDEFIIILSNISEMPIVKTIAESLIKQISQPILVDRSDVAVSASIGIALYPDHGTTSNQLMRVADKAMYEVKKSGKNNFAFAGTNDPKTSITDE
jgi:diguanylate cyclase (GGDEF)-like protein/PAS domain S-box-containing protein